MRPRVDRVDAPRVGEHRHAAQRAHRVDEQQRARLAAEVAEPGQRLVHARRRLALAEEQDGGLVLAQGRRDLVLGEGLARLALELDGLGAEARAHVQHALAPDARVADDDRLARLEQVRDAGLHPAVARARHHQDVFGVGLFFVCGGGRARFVFFGGVWGFSSGGGRVSGEGNKARARARVRERERVWE